jgi:hypothetical protein
MADEVAPYLNLPLAFRHGRVDSCGLEESIRANIRLILHNQVQGIAKPKGVAADPAYGANLPHHEFRHGRIQDVVREVRVALRRLERRLVVDKIDFVGRRPGRYLPYTTIHVSGTVEATGSPLKMEFEIEE